MDKVKEHFESESNEFDGIIIKLIPYYHQMLEALVSSIPFTPTQKISVVDLGCGTGTVAKVVKGRFPNARITCVDFSEKMIAAAKIKLKNLKGIDYRIEDFYDVEFDRKYDVAVSSLAIHHLVKDADKKRFYGKIFGCLNKGGVFFNADNVLGSNGHTQKVYIEKWVDFMRKSISRKEIDRKWLPKHEIEDSPSRIIEQIKWLEKIGFAEADILWKYYNFGVFGAYKK
jgi:tRNA (cmo5U34)-methyltransferase